MAAARKTKAKKAAVRRRAETEDTKPAAAKKRPSRRTAAKAPDNRRRFDRRDTQIAAQLQHAGGEVAGAVTNLSLQGCLFAPTVPLASGTRIKLKLSGESKPVAATVKAVSDQGVHCLLHAGGATLSRLSTDLDDMALLMLSAGRPTTATAPAQRAVKKPAARTKR